MAISSPLLEASIDGAHGVLLSIAGGSDLGLFEVSAAAQLIEEAAHDEANIIFGTVIDDALGDEVRVTVIAAGFDGGQPQKRVTRPVEQRPAQQRPAVPTPSASPAPPQASPMPGQRPAFSRPAKEASWAFESLLRGWDWSRTAGTRRTTPSMTRRPPTRSTSTSRARR
jgi:cell division protein FtsZ